VELSTRAGTERSASQFQLPLSYATRTSVWDFELPLEASAAGGDTAFFLGMVRLLIGTLGSPLVCRHWLLESCCSYHSCAGLSRSSLDERFAEFFSPRGRKGE